ncbi:MAG: hypothetical protein V7703_06290 [Hyphomicrobiales bacterium]
MFAMHGMLAGAAYQGVSTPEDNFEVTDSFSTSANSSSYTLSNADIGVADDSRVIYVAAIYARGTLGSPICSVGGTTLDIIVSNLNNGAHNHSVVLFAGVIDASHNDTADVVVDPSGSGEAMGFVVCVSYNNSGGAIPTDTAQSTSNTISGLTVDAGGVGICAFYAQNNVNAANFANATEIFVHGDNINSGGAVGKILGSSTATVTCDLSPTASGKYSIAAAFR